MLNNRSFVIDRDSFIKMTTYLSYSEIASLPAVSTDLNNLVSCTDYGKANDQLQKLLFSQLSATFAKYTPPAGKVYDFIKEACVGSSFGVASGVVWGWMFSYRTGVERGLNIDGALMSSTLGVPTALFSQSLRDAPVTLVSAVSGMVMGVFSAAIVATNTQQKLLSVLSSVSDVVTDASSEAFVSSLGTAGLLLFSLHQNKASYDAACNKVATIMSEVKSKYPKPV